jgi:predicted metalloprotease with PDZ domain
MSGMLPVIPSLLLLTRTAALDLGSIELDVNAAQAGRNFIHSHLVIPAHSGPLTLVYPKWIPGEHSPSGPINDVVGLKFRAKGKELAWQRDDVDMFAFHLDVPSGAESVEADFDLASQNSSIASPNFSRIKWNRLVLYPQGVSSDAVTFQANLEVPHGWRCASALKVAGGGGNTVHFEPAPLTRLVDSPALIGNHSKTIVLRKDLEKIEVFADNDAALEVKPETVATFKNLVGEAQALFGAHHYDSYRFLLTLSNHGGGDGLEHHETSEDGTAEDSFSDEKDRRYLGYLLSHEYTHSWNGKYRRPAGLATANFQDPMKGELLWVYEGMTEFIGTTLNPRSGLWTLDNYKDALAELAGVMEFTQGRTWRPLVDTARGVQLTYGGAPGWGSARRSADYYYEMVLIWLEADVKIRQLTGDKKSIDDFCKLFHGGETTGPKLVPYTFDDLVATLNAVAPFDWAGFLHDRIYTVRPHAPIEGIEKAGWKVVYTDKPNPMAAQYEGPKGADLFYSIGISVSDDGAVTDVLPDSPGAEAGLSPGMKFVGVNGMKFSMDRLKSAIADSNKPGKKIELLTDIGDETLKTLSVRYRGGARYPHLERDPSKPDLIAEIAAPHAK